MSIKTTVGQVAVAGGYRSDRPNGVLIDERAPRISTGRRRGNLYALVEVSGPATGREVLVRQMLELLRDAYSRWQGSVTAGLQQAIYAANNLLFEENRDSLPGEQRTAGISCVVLREGDLFVAQAGPAAVYVAQEGQVTRFPDISPWLDDVPLEEVDAAPLGARRDPNVALFHVQAAAGNCILLVESSLARRLPAGSLSDILLRLPAEEVLDALVSAGEGNDLSALVVQLAEEEAVGAPDRLARPSGVPASTTLTLGPVSQKLAAWWDRLDARGALRGAAGALAAGLARLGAVLLTLLRRMLPGQTSSQSARETRAATAETREPASRPGEGRRAKVVQQARRIQAGAGASGAAGGVYEGGSGGRRPAERAVAQPRSALARKLMIGAAIAIPLIVAAVVAFMYIQRAQAQRAEIDALWKKANDSWTQANAPADKATTLARLTEAQTALDQLIARRPERTDAVDLQKRVLARLDELTQVRRITWITTLKTYPSEAKLTRVVVEGGRIFVLDRNAGKVYHHQLDNLQESLVPTTADTVAVSKGTQVGSVLVADLVDMVWIPTGEGHQRGTLGILDSDGALLEYDPTTETLSPVRMAAFDTWRFPKLVGSYFGRFYVLDTSTSKIWRYMPTPDGYSSPPDDWLQTAADLAGAIDMAIGDSIYILFADGSIRRFTTGEPDKYDISDWDRPPSNPGALFTRPPDQVQSVYVADRGNSRIVQTKPEGLFEAQFRLADSSAGSDGDALSSVTSLFVDEIGGRAFFLSANKLYMIKLPK